MDHVTRQNVMCGGSFCRLGKNTKTHNDMTHALKYAPDIFSFNRGVLPLVTSNNFIFTQPGMLLCFGTYSMMYNVK